MRQFLAPVAAVALALVPVSLPGQAPTSERDAIIWHWFGQCAGKDSLMLEVRLDGQSIYSSAFPICQTRRGQIKPEPQQRLLEFRFRAVPRRFGPRSHATEPQLLECNVWESGGEQNAILLGVSFATADQVLLNMHHIALVDAPSRSERVRGLVVTTQPVRRGDRPPPH